MEREIKFRAWDGGEMLHYTNSHIFDLYEGMGGGNYTLMQYTGLKDKNGVEIYEGDIVKWKQASGGLLESAKDNDAYICSISWFMNGWSCRVNNDHCGFTFAGCHIEIIGNIYENPELI